jgi:hypothetical protein
VTACARELFSVRLLGLFSVCARVAVSASAPPVYERACSRMHRTLALACRPVFDDGRIVYLAVGLEETPQPSAATHQAAIPGGAGHAYASTRSRGASARASAKQSLSVPVGVHLPPNLANEKLDRSFWALLNQPPRPWTAPHLRKILNRRRPGRPCRVLRTSRGMHGACR